MRARGVVLAIALGTTWIFACRTGDLVVGDDTRDGDDGGGGDGMSPDGTPPDEGGSDARSDGDAGPCEARSGSCLEAGSPCHTFDDLGTCARAADRCCVTPCPEIAPPPPGFCDGGPVATKYGAFGCVAGFACAPIECGEAGGTCVGLGPSNCSGHFGDATKYSCGPGIGVGCCLP